MALPNKPNLSLDITPLKAPKPVTKPDTSFSSVVGAGFRMENDVVNAYQAINRPVFSAEKDFNVLTALKKSKYINTPQQSSFIQAQSTAEFEEIANKIEKEQQDREVLAEAGGFGIAAGIAAGVISPTIAIPLGVAGSTIKGAAKGAGLTAGAAAAQEGTLYATQETRTEEELQLGIATSIILGGILGGAVGHMAARTQAKVSYDMAIGQLSEAIPTSGIVGTGGHSQQLLPTSGTYRYVDGKGDKVEFTPQKLLIVTPESLPVIAKHVGGKVTNAALRAFAKAEGYDSIFVDAFETRVKGFHGTKAPVGTALEPRQPKALDVGQEPKAVSFAASADEAKVFGPNVIEQVIDTAEFKNITKRVKELRKAERLTKKAAKIKAVDELGEDVKGFVLDGKKGEIAAFKADDILTGDHILKEGLEVLDKSRLRKIDKIDNFSPFPSFGTGVQTMADEISGPVGVGGTGGAASVTSPHAGNLKAALPGAQFLVNQLIKTSPVARVIDQKLFPTASWMMAQMSNGGLRLGKNVQGIATATGGTIENRVHQHYIGMQKAYTLRDKLYEEYIYADGKAGGSRRVRSLYKGFRQDGKLSPPQFMEEVSHAMWNGDGHAIKEVADTAKAFREHIYEPVLKELQETGIIPKELKDDIDISFLNRIYNTKAIEANPHGFIELISKKNEEVLQEYFAKALKQQDDANKLSDELTADLKLTPEDAADLDIQLQARLREAEENVPPNVKRLEQDLHELKAQSKTIKFKFDRKDIDAEITSLEKLLKKDLRKIRKTRKAITTRRENLSQASTPAKTKAAIKQIADLKETRTRKFLKKLADKGLDDIDLNKATASAKEISDENAKEVMETILHTHSRLPAMEILQGKRGTELARGLTHVSSNDLAAGNFLVKDAEILASSYLRTTSADIEMMKKFGTVSGGNIIDQLDDQRLLLTKGLDPAKDAKEIADITAVHKNAVRDLEAVIARIRHTRGLPTNPDGMGYRLATVAKQANVLRYMGMVTVSSFPDVGRPIMKYSMTNVFKDAFIPMIRNFKELRLVKQEIELARGVTDVFMHTRSSELYGFDDLIGRKTTKFERAMDYGSSKMGLIAGFDYWTDAMKTYAGITAHAKILKSVDTVINDAGSKGAKEAREFLAAGGINNELSARIWAEVSNLEGGGKVNGIWLPNTEKWTDVDAKLAFRAHLVGEVDNTIVTPGAERALIADASYVNKVILQFKSFALSSTTKTLVAGLQQRDMAFTQGAMISLAFGAFSYYIWAISVGGKAQTEMENASLAKWADEAYARAGLDGALNFVHRAAERVPFLNDEDNPVRVTFAGSRNARRGNDDLMAMLLGPSADLAKTINTIGTSLGEPTQSTLHKLRTLLALQNHALLRRPFTQIEEATADLLNLPERRK